MSEAPKLDVAPHATMTHLDGLLLHLKRLMENEWGRWGAIESTIWRCQLVRRAINDSFYCKEIDDNTRSSYLSEVDKIEKSFLGAFLSAQTANNDAHHEH